MKGFYIYCIKCDCDNITFFRRKLNMTEDELALRCNGCGYEEGTE